MAESSDLGGKLLMLFSVNEPHDNSYSVFFFPFLFFFFYFFFFLFFLRLSMLR